MRRALVFTLALVMALGGVGCGSASASTSRSVLMAAPPQSQLQPGTEAGGDTAEDEDTFELPYFDDEDLQLETVSLGLSGGYAGDENGCYTLRDMGDGSTDILYFSYADATFTSLENPPRESELLRGHVAANQTLLTPVVAGAHLYLFQSNVEGASILRLDKDGANPLSLPMPAQHNFQTSGVVLWDGAAFLVMTLDLSGEKPVYTLVRADFDAGEVTVLVRFEAGLEYTIEGWWSKGPVLCEATALPAANDPAFSEAFANRDFHLFCYAPATGQRDTLLRYKQDQPTAVQGSCVFYWLADEAALYSLSAESKESTRIAQGFVSADPFFSSMQRTFYGGLVILQFSDANGAWPQSYAVDPASGEVFQPPLPSRNQDIAIVAEAGDFFLVRSGDRWVHRSAIDPDYDPNANPTATHNDHFISVSEYALISQQDYWAGTVQLTPIEDLVYQ
ncbi:MAG: hypothetical protein AB7V55_07265 [Oscillospiraceae bacterium]